MKESDIIVTDGPAGSAAAIRLANRNPALAARTMILERETFPRPKLCGGGATQHAYVLLRALQVEINASSYPIHVMRLLFEDLQFTFRRPNVFRVVNREEFDLALARVAQEWGIDLFEGESVVDICRDNSGVTILTNRAEYRAKIVIGADGAKSVVRSSSGLVYQGHRSRLIKVMTPLIPSASREFVNNTAVFDFTPVKYGIQGYYWDFPLQKAGAPLMNRGLFDSRVRTDRRRGDMKRILREEVGARGLDLADFKLKGHPERWFDPNDDYSADRILLAGDGAGAEPWLGEGISHALNFGMVAADAAIDGFARNDFSFSSYRQVVSRSGLGRRLRLKRLIAHYFYGNGSRWQYRIGWRIADIAFRFV